MGGVLRRFIANRVLISLELLLLIAGALLLAPVLMIGPLGSAEDFTAFSKAGHVAAFFSLLPLALLAIGYMRYPDEFTFAVDGPWIMAFVSVAVPLCVAIVSLLGLNGEGVRVVDLVVCLVALPLFHLMVVGMLGRRASQH